MASPATCAAWAARVLVRAATRGGCRPAPAVPAPAAAPAGRRALGAGAGEAPAAAAGGGGEGMLWDSGPG